MRLGVSDEYLYISEYEPRLNNPQIQSFRISSTLSFVDALQDCSLDRILDAPVVPTRTSEAVEKNGRGFGRKECWSG